MVGPTGVVLSPGRGEPAGTVVRVLVATEAVVLGPPRYLVFWPRGPYHERFILGKIFGRHRIRPTTNLRRLSAGERPVVFNTDTRFRPHLPDGLQPRLRYIIRSATDTRKSHVEAVFARVSGRRTLIDPTTHVGTAVEKSEEIAEHDGRVISCSLAAPNPDCVYRRLIDDTDAGGFAVDFRVPVLFGSIPLVHLKGRRVERRFSNTNDSTERVPPHATFTDPEHEEIRRSADEFGLDFGELDGLRDAADGQIYVVGVNTTPFGPPNGLPKAQAMRAVEELTEVFGKVLRQPDGRSRDA